MARFNTTDKRAPRNPSPGPLGTSGVANAVTGNGAVAYLYDEKSQLFLLATNSFFGQAKFYETAKAADDRFVQLVRTVTKADPAWMLAFIGWLRSTGNMRTAAVVASVEAALAAKGELDKSGPNWAQETGWARKMAQAGIGRADEVGEAVAYYFSKYPRAQIPKPVKRGLADAMVRTYNEYTALKYASENSKKEFTPDRLLNLLHPTTDKPWQSDLFGYLVARKYGEVEIPISLSMLINRRTLMGMPVAERKAALSWNDAPQMLKDAGMTWEALAGWLQGPMDAQAWEAIIPNMGYMALLRNLRNFDQARISNRAAAAVMAKLSSEDEVARSKQFPFRFLAAHRAAPNMRWSAALTMALDSSLANIPVLPGRTLVLVDTSGSMHVPFSEHSEMMRWDAASLFGIALAIRSPGTDLYSFSSSYALGGRCTKQFTPIPGADVLSETRRWSTQGYNLGGGTPTARAVQETYRNHDRVIILTDEQADIHSGYGVDQAVPKDKHFFTFNLAGYAQAHTKTDRFRHSFGGLTDACFPLISMIEEGTAGRWPWEVQN